MELGCIFYASCRLLSGQSRVATCMNCGVIIVWRALLRLYIYITCTVLGPLPHYSKVKLPLQHPLILFFALAHCSSSICGAVYCRCWAASHVPVATVSLLTLVRECSPLIFLNVYLAYKTRLLFHRQCFTGFTIYGCENPGGLLFLWKLV